MPPISDRSPTALEVYQRLKADVIRGAYAPQEKLLMSRLKTRYGTGVGPLREALTRLIGERLVTGISQRGYRVAPMSIAELAAIYDARAELEGLLIRLAIERGDDEWEAAILARAHTLTKITRVQDGDEMLERWDTRHQALHDAMVAGCGCLPLLQSRAALFDQAQRYRHLWLRQTVFSPQALANKHREHHALLDTILSRDAPAAGRLMREHLMTPVPIIRERLQQQGWG
ncbi:DNA-binding transcriptional regulator CsiR [Salinicola sp. CPA57]|uniref:DNA-binding transcriptional regulator CsiR n=1 Tax=Salinicola sp. CPA57 TaxID=1949080 RepID=UPI000DA15A22|nr:DNA-binding transcriptional regulator CsiR [Salinicola sp. CPA57]